VVDAAHRAGVRVFTVGLASPAYRPRTLKRLAADTGGDYALASSPERLQGIFDRLGAALSQQYLLRYHSLAKPSKRVTVEVRLRGVEAPITSTYTTPALRLEPAPPYRRDLGAVFWLSPAAVVIAALLCGLLVGGIVLLLLRNRGSGLLERVRQFVPILDHDDAGAQPRVGGAGGSRRSRPRLASFGSWERLEEDLDIARIQISAARIALMTVAGTALAMWMFATLSGTGGAALIGLAVPVAVRAYVKVKAMRQRRAFADQLSDNVQVVASAMRAGHSFAGALSVVVEEAPEPSRREFRRVVNDERLGKPIEDAFKDVAQRMRNDELEHIGLVARLQTQTGGNTAEVLDRLVDTLRSRADLRRLVRTLTAQGRLGGWVVSGLPVAVLAAMSILNPEYAQKIFATGAGHVMLVVSVVLIVLGSTVIRRIVDIKV
jgi:tight adherence protein B